MDDTPSWAKVPFSALSSYEKSVKVTSGMGPVGDQLEKHIDELMDQFQKWVVSRALDANIKEWFQGTYFDGDEKLIRRGT